MKKLNTSDFSLVLAGANWIKPVHNTVRDTLIAVATVVSLSRLDGVHFKSNGEKIIVGVVATASALINASKLILKNYHLI
jgi:hypothetical protein